MSSQIPSHVPEALVVDFDMRAVVDGQADMQSAWSAALANRPLVYTPHNGGAWIATSADVLEELYPDTKNLSNREIFIPAHEGDRVLPGETDPPRHTHLRKAILSRLTASTIREMEPRIREFTIKLIDAVLPNGRCEFISQFAGQLPIIMFLELAGVDTREAPKLRGFAEAIARGATPDIKNAGHKGLSDFLGDLCDKRRARPTDDLISQIVEFQVEGEPLSDDDCVGLCVGIFLGGLDTVASILGFIGRHLAEHPSDRDYIREHIADSGTQIIDEFLRRYSMVTLGRIVDQDFACRGVMMKKGDRVMLPTFLHGLDPERFADPLKLDLTRKGGNLAFGKGPHGCPGRPLARAELRIFLEEWVSRIPNFEVDPDQGYRVASGQVLAFEHLALRWPAVAT